MTDLTDLLTWLRECREASMRVDSARRDAYVFAYDTVIRRVEDMAKAALDKVENVWDKASDRALEAEGKLRAINCPGFTKSPSLTVCALCQASAESHVYEQIRADLAQARADNERLAAERDTIQRGYDSARETENVLFGIKGRPIGPTSHVARWLIAQRETLQADVQRLKVVIEWTLGENQTDAFPGLPDDWPKRKFYWRGELRKRRDAALRPDTGEKA